MLPILSVKSRLKITILVFRFYPSQAGASVLFGTILSSSSCVNTGNTNVWKEFYLYSPTFPKCANERSQVILVALPSADWVTVNRTTHTFGVCKNWPFRLIKIKAFFFPFKAASCNKAVTFNFEALNQIFVNNLNYPVGKYCGPVAHYTLVKAVKLPQLLKVIAIWMIMRKETLVAWKTRV